MVSDSLVHEFFGADLPCFEDGTCGFCNSCRLCLLALCLTAVVWYFTAYERSVFHQRNPLLLP